MSSVIALADKTNSVALLDLTQLQNISTTTTTRCFRVTYQGFDIVNKFSSKNLFSVR